MFGFRSSVALPGCNSFFYSSKFRRKCTVASICRSVLSSCEGCSVKFAFPEQKGSSNPLKLVASESSSGRHLHLELPRRSVSLRLPISTHEKVPKFKWNVKCGLWTFGGASVAVCLSFSTTGRVHAESSMGNNKENDNSSLSSTSRGKKVYTDYSITGIPGDGRCLFRSVAHGARIRSGKPLPDEILQRQLADELRAMVADEFINRCAETELMPITVYMHDEDFGGLIPIAEYGQEYGKGNPIQVLYHGSGHYDALQIPQKRVAKSRL